ncbi:MAG: DUF192 domain-containing protein [Candidatus Pacebacteria bacterium]|nr:DUF192 domain-containing protein [Candidatus Paceibacterota bacterium]
MKQSNYALQQKFGSILVVVGVLVVIVVGTTRVKHMSFLNQEGSMATQDSLVPKFQDRERRTITVGAHTLEVEVVTTAESTAQGLSGREAIGADGMLFIFPGKSVRNFWMPQMQFDLDLVWVDDTVVTGVTKNVPKPAAGQTALPTYASNRPVNIVLELPAGMADDLSIEPGTVLIY